jgi:hypothetical protein
VSITAFFSASRPSIVRRFHEGPLGLYIDEYAACLVQQQRSRITARRTLCLVADLSRWLRRRRLELDQFDEVILRQYRCFRARTRPLAYCPIIQTTRARTSLLAWRATRAAEPIYSAAMSSLLQPLHLLLMMFAGWVNRHQLDVIDYLQEENRVLKERLGGRRIRFTNAERRRLARKAHVLGRKVLKELETLVTPDTLLRWHRQLVASKWNYAQRRGPGRPRVMRAIVDLILRMAQDNPSTSWRITTANAIIRVSQTDSCGPPLSSPRLSRCIGASV